MIIIETLTTKNRPDRVMAFCADKMKSLQRAVAKLSEDRYTDKEFPLGLFSAIFPSLWTPCDLMLNSHCFGFTDRKDLTDRNKVAEMTIVQKENTILSLFQSKLCRYQH